MESTLDTVHDPTKLYVLRKNQSFSYIQPRSRAPDNFKAGVVERRPKLSLLTNLKGMMQGLNLGPQKKAKFGLDDPDPVVPYGGYSSPDVGQNMLQDENIFDTAPWSITDYAKGNGGLRNAINFSLEEGIIKDVKWVGTIGLATDELSSDVKEAIYDKLKKDYSSIAIFPDDFTFQGHYRNFCKQILWPTLHYQVPDDAKLKAFEDHSWQYYKQLNEHFASKIAEEYKPGDIIWVHDYHLLLLPQMLRERLGPQAKIAFFLHTAFPSSEVFRCLAQRKNLLMGMLGANSIGFQTPEYCRHFLQTCNRILLADIVSDGLLYDGKYILVHLNPIGIDAKKLAAQIQDPEVDAFKKLIKEKWAGKQLVVNRDKLDKLRGVKQKLLGYETLLSRHPELIDKVTFVQICLKSSAADEDLEYEILCIVDRINSLASDFTVSPPVVFLHQDIEFAKYLALLSAADTFIVSTMREGMNLTCHEYIVATEANKPPLILSEFTGSASIFRKGALLINPWDTSQIASQLYTALTMSAEEKEVRWKELDTVLLDKNCYSWVQNLISCVESAWQKQSSRAQTALLLLSNLHFGSVYSGLSKSKGKRVFVLDFDALGGDKLLSSAHVTHTRKMEVISEIAQDPRNEVFVMSYLKRTDMDLMYGRNLAMGIISENGAYVKFPNSQEWTCLAKETGWMDLAVQVVSLMVERLPGSYIEVQDASIRYHCENVEDKERSEASISDCVTHINETFVEDDIHATAIRGLVAIEPKNLLVKAFSLILNKWDSIDLLIYISNSNPITEPVFDYCNSQEGRIGSVFTVAAGQVGDTSARLQVDGMNKLLSILANLKNDDSKA